MFITAEGLIDQAKNLFLSERFDTAFEIIRDSFDENDISDETIMKFLKGEIGCKVDGDNVSFGENSDDIEIDEEYKEDVDSVLFEHRTLFKHEEFGLLIPNQYFKIGIANYLPAEENDLLRQLQAKLHTVVRVDDTLLRKANVTTWSDYMYIDDEGILFFSENDKTIIKEVSIINTDPKLVAKLYNDFHNY